MLIAAEGPHVVQGPDHRALNVPNLANGHEATTDPVQMVDIGFEASHRSCRRARKNGGRSKSPWRASLQGREAALDSLIPRSLLRRGDKQGLHTPHVRRIDNPLRSTPGTTIDGVMGAVDDANGHSRYGTRGAVENRFLPISFWR